MHHVADPYIATAGGECAVIRLMVHPGLRLRDAEVDHVLAVIRVHAVGPVLHRQPARRGPAQQGLDLRAYVFKRRRGPVNLPRDSERGFEQRAKECAVGC
ncbi:hypothetical protein D3C71_1858870 [compost metagenome]